MSKTDRKKSSSSRRKSSARKSLNIPLKHESTILEEPSREETLLTLPPVEKVNYQDEVVFIFFDSMLESIIDKWKPISDEIVCLCKDATKESPILSLPSECSMLVDETLISGSQSNELQSKRSSTFSSSIDTQRYSSDRRKSSKASEKLKKNSEEASLSIELPKAQLSYESFAETNVPEPSHSLDWILVCPDEKVKITFKNGNRYEGPVTKKVMHGYGKFIWADGAVYEGDFVHGSATGKGNLKYCDLSTYVGEFCKNRLHGKGIFKVSGTEMIYSGEWNSGRKHGQGWLSYEIGNTYTGHWIDDFREGYGVREYKSGEKYSGNWFKGDRHGNGSFAWSNNDFYCGSWSEGYMEGYGEYTWRTFLNKTFTFPIKTFYSGTWVNSMRTGVGIMNFGTNYGAQLAGVWDLNNKHGAGVIICDNGTVIEKNPLFWHDKPIHVPTDYEDSCYMKHTMPSVENLKKSPSLDNVDEFYIKSNFLIISNQLARNKPSENLCGSLLSQLAPIYPSFSEECVNDRTTECNPLWIPVHAPPEEQNYSFYIDLCIQNYFCKLYRSYSGNLEPNSPRIKSDKWETSSKYSKWNIQEDEETNQSLASEHSSTETSLSSKETEIRLMAHQAVQVGIEEKYINNAVILYLPNLYNLYYKYSTIATSEVIKFKTVLVRLFLWQMLKDLRIQERTNYSLIDIDNTLMDNSCCGLETPHDPFEKIYFWQFLHIVLTLAWITHIPRNITRECRVTGILATILKHFMIDIVEESVEVTISCSLSRYRDIAPIKKIYNLYLKLGGPITARQFLCNTCVKKGHTPPCYVRAFDGDETETKFSKGRNTVAIGGRIFYLEDDPPDIGIAPPEASPALPQDDPFRKHLVTLRFVGPKKIIKCLTTVCPQILWDGVIVNMDYSLSFIEFYDVLLMCTQLAVDKARQREAMHNWREEKKRQEELEELERLLELERLERLENSGSKITIASVRSMKNKEKRRSAAT